ncbi:uncharacterized protein LOC144630941 [Oculina patagonica]
MEKYFLAFAFVLIGVADAQIFRTLPTNETGSAVSFQVILNTGVICASINETFQTTACSDPGRVEVVLNSIREVHWLRNKIEAGGRFEINGTCQSDSLAHSISGISGGLGISNLGSREFLLDGTEEIMNVSFIELTWDLSVEGQAQGAEMKFILFFFTKNVTIIFEGQKADVFNGTVKTTYEITNWQFCDIESANEIYGEQTLDQCRENRRKYKSKENIDETVLELKFDITKFSADDDVDAIINCFRDKGDDFAPVCQFGNHYAVTFSEITTIDGAVACLPNEYPRINDCEAPEDSVIYRERLTKKGKDPLLMYVLHSYDKNFNIS